MRIELIEDNAGGLILRRSGPDIRREDLWCQREDAEPGTALRDMLILWEEDDLLGNLPVWLGTEHYPEGGDTHPMDIVSGEPPDLMSEYEVVAVAAVWGGPKLTIHLDLCGTAARRYLGIEEVPR